VRTEIVHKRQKMQE